MDGRMDGWAVVAQKSYASFTPPAGELQHEVAEQRELCQKAQAALAATRAQLATLLPIEAELQREVRVSY